MACLVAHLWEQQHGSQTTALPTCTCTRLHPLLHMRRNTLNSMHPACEGRRSHSRRTPRNSAISWRLSVLNVGAQLRSCAPLHLHSDPPAPRICSPCSGCTGSPSRIIARDQFMQAFSGHVSLSCASVYWKMSANLIGPISASFSVPPLATKLGKYLDM